MKITLCGSLRFEDEIHIWHECLALQGHIPYGMVVYPSMKGGNKDWYTPEQKAILDLVHLAKISNSDAILVVDMPLGAYFLDGAEAHGYIGKSTRREIEWAYMNDKTVFFASVQYAAVKRNPQYPNEYRQLIDTTWYNTFTEMYPR